MTRSRGVVEGERLPGRGRVGKTVRGAGRIYRVYGLRLRSEVDLPDLCAGEPGVADVVVRFGRVPCAKGRGPREDGGVPPADSFEVAREGVGAFRVAGGREIVLDPFAGVDDAEVRRHVMASLLPVLLHQRGHLVLHGSSVSLCGSAVVFLGASGWGKSTLAAAFCAREHTVLTDDIAPLLDGPGGVTVAPGCPQLKVCEPSARAVGMDFGVLAPVPGQPGKRAVALRPVALDPVPVGRVLVLADGDRLRVEPLSQRQTFAELMRHAYIRFDDGGGDAAAHFARCAALSSRTPSSRLRFPRRLDGLRDLVDRVTGLAQASVRSRPAVSAP